MKDSLRDPDRFGEDQRQGRASIQARINDPTLEPPRYVEEGAYHVEVYNMGVGFCILVSEKDAATTLSILQRHGRRAQIIGRVIEDEDKGVHLPRESLTGHGKAFTPI